MYVYNVLYTYFSVVLMISYALEGLSDSRPLRGTTGSHSLELEAAGHRETTNLGLQLL